MKEKCPECGSLDIQSMITLFGWIRQSDGTICDEVADKKLKERECRACGHHWLSTRPEEDV